MPRKYSYVKKVHHYICDHCGEPNTSSKPYTRCCHKIECQKAKARAHRMRKVKKVREENTVVLVDSICPKCRRKHKAESKWSFCPEHEYLRHETFYGEILHTAHA